MSDAARLAGYIDVWRGAIDDFVAVLERVPDEQWTTPTDLPGWDVRACAAHTAHLESVLAGRGEETADIGEPAHVTGLMGMYTEIGVVVRRERTPGEIVAELREVVEERHAHLLADPPTDAAAKPEVIFGGVPWTWGVLLRNRPLDVWMHEQDVRRAVGMTGGLDSRAASHTIGYLAEGFGFVLGKKAQAPVGTTAVLSIGGEPDRAFEIDDDGRGRMLGDTPTDPTVRLRLAREAYVVLAGGRRTADSLDPADVVLEGDTDLGTRLVAALATTP